MICMPWQWTLHGFIIRNVAIDDLGESDGAIFSEEVKDLVLNAC